MSQKSPDPDVEFPFVYQQRLFDIFLHDKGMAFQ
jgi:hypothetical protein